MNFFHLPPVLQHRVAKGTARRALGFAAKYRGRLALFVAIIVVDAAAISSIPLFYEVIIDRGILHRDRTTIIVLAGFLALIVVLDQALGVAGTYLGSRIGQGIIFDLRSAVYRHVQQLPLAFFTRTQTGALMSRLDNDVIGAQQAFTDLASVVIGNTFTVIISFGVMFALSWQIALVALIALPVGALVVRLASRRVAGLSRGNLQRLSDLSAHMSERFNVGGALLVTLFGRRQHEAAAFEDRAAQVRDLEVKMAVYSRAFSAALLVVAGLLTALIFGWGGLLVADGTLKVGTVVALATALARIYGPLMSLGNAPIDVVNALVAFERLFEVLDVPDGLRERPDARDIPSGPARIEVDHVDFSYPGRQGVSVPSLEVDEGARDDPVAPVLHDVSFSIEPGQMVALVGETGSGKTSVAYLIRRLYDVSSGTIRINGVDVRDATFDSLQHTVGMVTQDVHLFHDTIRANLRYANAGASDDMLLEALDRAELRPTIDTMPGGLDTVVGDRGFRLSGGEKQRLALARVLLQQPSVVILDEATAQLDTATEQAVQQSLEVVLHGRTSLVIAHRLSTVRQADLILVLDQGRIVERGSHRELMANEGRYFTLSTAQVGPADPAG